MIATIGESTTFIKSTNQDKPKLKARIEATDQQIVDHKEFIKERAVLVQ